jgi:hypothetical protein
MRNRLTVGIEALQRHRDRLLGHRPIRPFDRRQPRNEL